MGCEMWRRKTERRGRASERSAGVVAGQPLRRESARAAGETHSRCERGARARTIDRRGGWPPLPPRRASRVGRSGEDIRERERERGVESSGVVEFSARNFSGVGKGVRVAVWWKFWMERWGCKWLMIGRMENVREEYEIVRCWYGNYR